MIEREGNARLVRQTLEEIAERAGEDRASVFLDIIINTLLGGKTVIHQQQMLNEIAAVYGVKPALLKSGPHETDDDIPF